MSPSHIKSSSRTPYEISNAMGLRLGIYYFTLRHMEKWIPPTSILCVGHKLTFDIR